MYYLKYMFCLHVHCTLSLVHVLSSAVQYAYNTCYFNKNLIKRENVQDSTSQKIFDLEKLVFYSY